MHTVPSPPSDLTVSQVSLTSVSVVWTPSPRGASGYIVYYSYQLYNRERKSSRRVGASTTSIRINYLRRGESYSFSVIATNSLTSSTEIGPLNITLGTTYVTVLA